MITIGDSAEGLVNYLIECTARDAGVAHAEAEAALHSAIALVTCRYTYSERGGPRAYETHRYTYVFEMLHVDNALQAALTKYARGYEQPSTRPKAYGNAYTYSFNDCSDTPYTVRARVRGKCDAVGRLAIDAAEEVEWLADHQPSHLITAPGCRPPGEFDVDCIFFFGKDTDAVQFKLTFAEACDFE